MESKHFSASSVAKNNELLRDLQKDVTSLSRLHANAVPLFSRNPN